MTHKIILINGPPYSGKDTAGKILRHILPSTRLYKMSQPLKNGLREFFGFSIDDMRNDIELYKDQRVVAMFRAQEGVVLTWREVQISLSEDWAKHIFGKDIIGRIVVSVLSRPTTFTTTVITDSGFLEEVLPLVHAFGAENILLIQLTKDECSFEGDSRSYIELDDIGVTTVLLNNRFPLVATEDMPITFEMQLGKAVRGWLGEEQEE